MKQTPGIWIKAGLLSIAFFIIARAVFARLFGFFEPRVDGIIFQIRELDGWSTSMLFSCLLALVPVLVVLMWRLAPVVSLAGRVASVLTILIFIIAGILVRHQMVAHYFISVVRPFFLSKGRLNVTYPIDPVNFVYYMFGGLCIGWTVSFLLYRQWKKRPGIIEI